MSTLLDKPIFEESIESLEQLLNIQAAETALSRYILPFSRERLYSGQATLREIRERLTNKNNPFDKRFDLFFEFYMQELTRQSERN